MAEGGHAIAVSLLFSGLRRGRAKEKVEVLGTKRHRITGAYLIRHPWRLPSVGEAEPQILQSPLGQVKQRTSLVNRAVCSEGFEPYLNAIR